VTCATCQGVTLWGTSGQLAPSAFVADLAEKVPALLTVCPRLNPFRREAIDHAEDAGTLGGGADHDLEGVRRSAEDPADLGTALYLVQHVNGIGVAQQNAKDVARANRLDDGFTALDQFGVVTFGPDQAGTGGFAKGYANFACGTDVAITS
jgi:hypothetical protein